MLGGQSDSFRVVLGHEVRHAVIPSAPQYSVHISVEDGEVYDNVGMAWTEDEREPVVLGRLAGWRRNILPYTIHITLSCVYYLTNGLTQLINYSSGSMDSSVMHSSGWLPSLCSCKAGGATL